jgi:UDP-N-acetylglucosamine--N-acetylmuramyl-(pentapeptide) pyrophosphoryl-undecaprenol N-acetylglucosamine transferase
VKILVITGASGGHIFPALGFLDTLKEKHKNIDTLLILPKNNITNQIGEFGYKVNYISISPIKLNLDFSNFMTIFNFFKGSLESIAILLKFKPDIVVGFGSLTCIPTLIFAWLFRIKTLIHEQNVIPGRANRFLAGFSDKIAVSFAETKDYFKKYKRKVVFTGNPIRKELVRIDKDKALNFFGFSEDKFTILIMGGSQGSHRINQEFLRAISTVSDKFKIQVIHLTGRRDYDLLQHSYKDLNINSRLFKFLESMGYAYSASDLVISRAGASTIAETIFYGLAAIIIPYPFAYKHQMANARALEKIGSAIIIKDNELDGSILRQIIDGLINNPQRLKDMRSRYDSLLRVDANTLFTDNVLSLN